MFRLSRCASRSRNSETAVRGEADERDASISPDAISGGSDSRWTRLEQDERRDAEQEDRVDDGREDLEPQVAERPLLRRRPLAKRIASEGQADPGDVGEACGRHRPAAPGCSTASPRRARRRRPRASGRNTADSRAMFARGEPWTWGIGPRLPRRGRGIQHQLAGYGRLRTGSRRSGRPSALDRSALAQVAQLVGEGRDAHAEDQRDSQTHSSTSLIANSEGSAAGEIGEGPKSDALWRPLRSPSDGQDRPDRAGWRHRCRSVGVDRRSKYLSHRSTIARAAAFPNHGSRAITRRCPPRSGRSPRSRPDPYEVRPRHPLVEERHREDHGYHRVERRQDRRDREGACLGGKQEQAVAGDVEHGHAHRRRHYRTRYAPGSARARSRRRAVRWPRA